MIKMQVALIVGVIGLTPAHASMRGLQESRISQPSAAIPASPLLAVPTKNPFSGIFVVPHAQRVLPQPALRTKKPPRVVCGMVLVPANPNLDPKMILDLPPKPDVENKIRVLTPKVCRE